MKSSGFLLFTPLSNQYITTQPQQTLQTCVPQDITPDNPTVGHVVMRKSTSNTDLIRSLVSEIYSRKLLLLHYPHLKEHSSPIPWITGQAASPRPGSQGRSVDPNVVMILSVLLCALICALGLNSIIRCALRWSNRMAVANPAARPAETGLKRKALQQLPRLVYSAGMRVTGSIPECAICLSEFVPGEQIRVLPKCNHGFHLKCIDRWLAARSSCPTCRRSMFTPCEKTSPSCVGHAIPAPLQPEGLITSYHF
ncbi:hypothetical protein Cni_G24332 [Canna indica]|uniref:RING-type domain-containing protein n=1 Tax=Canna indica TaxID=4628 RepID=A0AAQ3KZY8_9LILI|nr:hypothetical protein Cni_G24332 [Canna indica]